ncbi:hypothetical protein ACU4GD_41640 [Cupriavidus basilensis]
MIGSPEPAGSLRQGRAREAADLRWRVRARPPMSARRARLWFRSRNRDAATLADAVMPRDPDTILADTRPMRWPISSSRHDFLLSAERLACEPACWRASWQHRTAFIGLRSGGSEPDDIENWAPTARLTPDILQHC